MVGGGEGAWHISGSLIITQSCVRSFSELRAVADILGKRNYEFESEGSVAVKRLKLEGN